MQARFQSLSETVAKRIEEQEQRLAALEEELQEAEEAALSPSARAKAAKTL